MTDPSGGSGRADQLEPPVPEPLSEPEVLACHRITHER